MARLNPGRQRVIALLSVATVLLVGRVGAAELGVDAAIERVLYGGALLCLIACVVAIARDAQ